MSSDAVLREHAVIERAGSATIDVGATRLVRSSREITGKARYVEITGLCPK